MSEKFTGTIELTDRTDRTTLTLNGETGYADLKGLEGRVRVGGHGQDGVVYLANKDGKSTVRLDAGASSVALGGYGQYGSLYLRDPEDRKMISMYGNHGQIVLYCGRRKEAIRLSGRTGNAHIGGGGQHGDLYLDNADGETSLHLSGETGAIHVENADCAEDFRVADGAILEAGDVVVLNSSAALKRSEESYDRRVAGVISGAGDTRPGIVLGRGRRRGHRLPVALIGRVNCKVDAEFGAVEVGDLLTTSPRPGHAMKAGDPARAFGAVLGKALGPIAKGDGMIPVLVALQ